MKTIVVYGFEYDSLIYYKRDALLCKSPNSSKPIYAAPIIIEETDITTINERIRDIEKNKGLFLNIIELAKHRLEEPKWQVALFESNLKLKGIGYESEGDENGDSR
jgi:hypothetical protein